MGAAHRHRRLPARGAVPAALPDHPGRAESRQLPLDVLLRHRHPLPAPRLDAGQHPLPRQRQLPGAGVSGADRLVPAAGAGDQHGPGGADGLRSERPAAGRLHGDLPRRQHRDPRSPPAGHRLGPGRRRAPSPLGRHDGGGFALRRRHRPDQLGPAAGGSHRRGSAVLGPPPARLGRGLLGSRDGREAVSAVPARTVAVPVSAGRPDAGVRPDARGVRRCLAGDEPAGAVARAGQLAELLDLQLRPDGRSRFDLVRPVAGRASGRGPELPGPGDLRTPVCRDRRSDPGRAPPAADRAGDVPGDRRLPADQQGLLPAVRVVAAALRRAGPPRVAGLADPHRGGALLLRRDLVASRWPARSWCRRSGQGLLARRDRPDGRPAVDRRGRRPRSLAAQARRRTPSSRVGRDVRRPDRWRPGPGTGRGLAAVASRIGWANSIHGRLFGFVRAGWAAISIHGRHVGFVRAGWAGNSIHGRLFTVVRAGREPISIHGRHFGSVRTGWAAIPIHR